MLRWMLLALTILGFVLVFSSKSALVLAFGLLLGGVGLFGFIFALAADRISANARPDTSMASTEDLIALNNGRLRAATQCDTAAAADQAADRGHPKISP